MLFFPSPPWMDAIQRGRVQKLGILREMWMRRLKIKSHRKREILDITELIEEKLAGESGCDGILTTRGRKNLDVVMKAARRDSSLRSV